MKLIEDLFKKYVVIQDSLLKYGFREEEGAYIYHRLIHNDEFDLQVVVKDEKIDARLVELEFGEEYIGINREQPRRRFRRKGRIPQFEFQTGCRSVSAGRDLSSLQKTE